MSPVDAAPVLTVEGIAKAFRSGPPRRRRRIEVLRGAALEKPLGERPIVPGMQVRDVQGAEPAAIAEVADLDGVRLLEVGCGEGRLTRFAASRAREVYAFDPDGARVRTAEASLAPELRERVSFGVHDADALDVQRRRFDLALCGWSL